MPTNWNFSSLASTTRKVPQRLILSLEIGSEGGSDDSTSLFEQVVSISFETLTSSVRLSAFLIFASPDFSAFRDLEFDCWITIYQVSESSFLTLVSLGKISISWTLDALEFFSKTDPQTVSQV